MNPVTHLLLGWSTLAPSQRTNRDLALVVWAGVLPDIDGLGLVIDLANRLLERPETFYYQNYHRLYTHGLPAALIIAVITAALAKNRLRAAAGALAAVHLHFLGDIIGSRGPGVEDIWGIFYLAPWSTGWEIAWSHQWPLAGWQNTVITTLLLLYALYRAARGHGSPLAVINRKTEAAVTATLRGYQRGCLKIGFVARLSENFTGKAARPKRPEA